MMKISDLRNISAEQNIRNASQTHSVYCFSTVQCRYIRKFIIFVFLFLLIFSTIGCGADTSDTPNASDNSNTSDDSDNTNDSNANADSDDAADSNNYLAIVEEHAAIMLDYDSYGVLFDSVLDAVGDYLDGTADLTDTVAIVEETVSSLTACDAALTDYSVPEDLSETMLEYDILPEEFELFADLRTNQIQDYLTSLSFLSDFLAYEEADDSDFAQAQIAFWYELYSTEQESYRGYYYYGSVNYWFAEWDESQAAAVQDVVVSQLQSYLPDTYVWETSQSAAEEKTMSYLDLLEDCVTLASQHLGNMDETADDLMNACEDVRKLAENVD